MGYFKGFRELLNINDPKIACHGQTSCDLSDNKEFDFTLVLDNYYDDNLSALWMMMYIPAGTRRSAVVFDRMPTTAQTGVVGRFGHSIDCEIPKTYDDFKESYPDGPSIIQMRDACGFTRTYEGKVYVTNTNYHEMLTEGGWLHTRVLSYVGDLPSYFTFLLAINIGTYRKWYNCMNEQDGWDEDGDPKYGFTACDNLSTSPTPTTSPTPNDCSINICKGNSCWDGKKYIAG
ncbi:MAG: hypothetical protein WCK16_04450, partial [Candidatus Moraniibacteriota bacterium]